VSLINLSGTTAVIITTASLGGLIALANLGVHHARRRRD
jgi:hypothetical protein